MSTFHDDPRVSAYVLGEMLPDECASFEAEIARDPALQAEVDAMSDAAAFAKGAYASTPRDTLTPAQREAVHEAARRPRVPRRTGLLAAAAFLLTAGLGVFAVVSIQQLSPGGAFDMALAPAREEVPDGMDTDGLETVRPVTVQQAPREIREQLDALGYAGDWESRPQMPERQAEVQVRSTPRPESPPVQDGNHAVSEVFRSTVRPAVDSPHPTHSTHVFTPPEMDAQVRGDAELRRPPYIMHTPPRPDLVYPGGETFTPLGENPFLRVWDEPLSTFGIDVDTASYAILRRYITHGQRPPRHAVRIEEMINYFDYDYPAPEGGEVLAADIEAVAAPWNPEHRLVRIGIKGQELELGEHPPANLVFLIDVSGSMRPANRLPLVRRALKMLVSRLRPVDRVAIVVYAGQSGLHLPSTPGSEIEVIRESIDQLVARGGTNAGDGIQRAYRVAQEHFIPGGVNRVILCTDGDFNVGITDRGELGAMVAQKAQSGVFLNVLGFGMGNLKDDMLEHLSAKGNGFYAYIDTESEARKVFVHELMGTLVTIARDVKIQVEFNPAHAEAYRLIGYENRMLAAEDFLDDRKNAGEIGAGHTVTALYEVVPRGKPLPIPRIEDLRYQRPGSRRPPVELVDSDELLTLKVRYQPPEGGASTPREWAFVDDGHGWDRASIHTRWAAAVAAFGMILRESDHKGGADIDAVIRWAHTAIGEDPFGYREEFLALAEQYRARHGRR